MKKVIIAILAVAVLAAGVVFAVAQRPGHDGAKTGTRRTRLSPWRNGNGLSRA